MSNCRKSRLAEHLASQLEAISRETAARSLRQWDAAAPWLGCWQRRRIQHQEFERRLLAMTQERKIRLAQATGLVEQQTLQRKSRSMKDGWRVADMRWRK